MAADATPLRGEAREANDDNTTSADSSRYACIDRQYSRFSLTAYAPLRQRRNLAKVGRRQSHRQHERPDGTFDDRRSREEGAAKTRRPRRRVYRRQHWELPGDG